MDFEEELPDIPYTPVMTGGRNVTSDLSDPGPSSARHKSVPKSEYFTNQFPDDEEWENWVDKIMQEMEKRLLGNLRNKESGSSTNATKRQPDQTVALTNVVYPEVLLS